ncbi:hypothetical protein B0H34DRAFT_700271 [Crassisporium funariophilum]|nr:hypothetical protein B0H34DRAFT_700271 [Crassisporium funariophilum]
MIEQVSVENAKLAAAVTDMHSSGEELREEVAALQARLRAETARRERMVLMWSWWKWEPMPLSFEVLFGKGMDAFTMDEGTELSLEEIETAVRKYLNKIGLTVGIPEASHHKLTERTVRRLMKRIIKGRLDAKGFAAPTVFPRLLSEKQLEALAEAAKVAEAEAAKVAAAAADPTVAAPPAIPAPVNGGRPQPPPRRAPQASSSQVTQDPRRRPRSNMAPPLFTKSPPHLPESDDVDELVDDILTTYTTQGYLGLSDGPPPGEASSSSQVALKPTDHPSIKASGKRRRADDDDGNAGEEGRPSKQARPTFLDRLGLAHGPQPQLFGATRPANPAMWAHEHRDHRMTTSPDSPPPDSGPSHRPGTAILPEEDYMSEPEYVDEGIVKEEEEEDECEIVPPYYPGSE